MRVDFNQNQNPASEFGSFRVRGFNPFLRWRTMFTYTRLSGWHSDRWCGWDLRSCTICTCWFIV